ncbi:MAG: hypothetical protein ACM36B_02755 [Bacteroidota bacterium]
MDKSAVLAKTAKGGEEIKSRAHGLAQKLRALLIMVDGTSTAGDLLARFGGIPDVEAGLEALVAQGFVEIRGGPPAAPAAPAVPATSAAPTVAGSAAPTAPAPPAAAGPQTRQQAMSALTRMLHDAIGPDADLLTGRLEKAKTRAEFIAAVERCTETLEALAGKTRAQAFGARAAVFAEQHFGGA